MPPRVLNSSPSSNACNSFVASWWLYCASGARFAIDVRTIPTNPHTAKIPAIKATPMPPPYTKNSLISLERFSLAVISSSSFELSTGTYTDSQLE